MPWDRLTVCQCEAVHCEQSHRLTREFVRSRAIDRITYVRECGLPCDSQSSLQCHLLIPSKKKKKKKKKTLLSLSLPPACGSEVMLLILGSALLFNRGYLPPYHTSEGKGGGLLGCGTTKAFSIAMWQHNQPQTLPTTRHSCTLSRIAQLSSAGHALLAGDLNARVGAALGHRAG